MSTDAVDADDEVLLPGGVDLSRFEKNPVVMLCHAYGQPGSYYPLPVGKVVWTRKRPKGVLAGVRFTDKTPMGREVKALFDDDVLRSFSVGFRPIEASPMTSAEADSRPDWKAAFERTRGRVNVHRRWHLIELSVAPVPSNPDALVTRFKSKGLSLPSWLEIPPSETPPVADDAPDETKAVDTDLPPLPPVETKAAKPPAEETPAEEATETPEEEADEEEAGEFRRHDHVDVSAPHFKGCGRIVSLHTKGLVPHVEEHIRGTPESPAARVKCYQAKGDGHVPTDEHVGVMVKHLTKRGKPMEAPTSKSFAAPDLESLPPLPDPLPALVPLAEPADQVLAQLHAMLGGDTFKALAADRLEQELGFV
jgi:phage head maturation protease